MSTVHDGTPPDPVQVVVLAAGTGTRPGQPMPRALTALASGRPILAHQIDGIRSVFGTTARITAVVGFKKEMIMEIFPWLSFTYNERYDSTNTAKSLLRGLSATGPGGVLWINGDVVFDHRLLARVRPLMGAGESFVCVNTAAVGEEQVAYTRTADGLIETLSKTVRGGEGEAVGVNYVCAADKPVLLSHLAACCDRDYFERAIETAIEAGMRVLPVDTGDYWTVEIDVDADLARANAEVAPANRAAAGTRIVAPRAPVHEQARRDF
ncbi:MAG: phosphocholine cytidylyltransferase family protein [Sporichthyaceae bacterium]